MVAKSQQNTSSKILLEYCKDINEWPNRWAIDNGDIQIGKNINEYFKLFLIDRIKNKCAKSTIKIYARSLLALGGTLIQCINDDKHVRLLSPRDIILKHVDNTGGPNWQHARDGFALARYNSVCRQFFKYIINDKNIG